MSLYVVVDIGCIECGEETKVLGVFADKSEAEHVAEDHGAPDYFNGGQHAVEVFETDGVIAGSTDA
jgi:hypothetical protein